MTFDELQLIVQSIAIAQRESQAMQQETQLLVQSIACGVGVRARYAQNLSWGRIFVMT